jgi:hypothetical protein
VRSTQPGRKGDDEVVGAHGAGTVPVNESEIAPVVRKVIADLLSDVSDDLDSPDGELQTDGQPLRRFSGATAGASTGTPDDDEDVPSEVLEAVRAAMQDLSPDQADALASLFEAMGEAAGGDEQDAPLGGFSNAEMRSLERASARGVGGTVLKWLIRWFRTSGKKYLRPAIQAARKGVRAFMKWKNGLPWPVRVAIGGLGPELVIELVKWLASGAGLAAEPTRAAVVGAEADEPDDTEEAVRKVLAILLTEAAEELHSGDEPSTPDEEQEEPAGVERHADLEVGISRGSQG